MYMINRVYVAPKISDSRGNVLCKSFNTLGLKSKVTNIEVIDSYLIDAKFTDIELDAIGSLLTNKNLESYSINTMPDLSGFSYILEVGYAPGVTDNVARTVIEEISETFKKPFVGSDAVYTSKVYLLAGKLNIEDVNKIAQASHNSLIERARILLIDKINNKNNFNLPLEVPAVILPKKKSVIDVSLNISDEELINIGKQGIMDQSGSRRGPLALDLESMKVIQKYFKGLNRKPTDIELESLAQTWSEHCKHTIFANPIDDIKDGLYKTYIKGATNKIRKDMGKKDFCVSVFSDNAGGIVFDNKYLVTHKVETHNSPSALDPFGGAITGIVGVNRDTIGFGLGAKPVANMYGYCFGDPYDTRPLYRDKNKTIKMLPSKRIMDGVIKGVNVGGNCSGIPTTTGFVRYDDRFRGKPLVFVGTVGLIPKKVNGKNSWEKQAQKGDYIVVVGGRVGADGIHGATFSSVVMDSSSPATAVQIGDPITQKKLSDVIVKEARDMDLYNSITDNGAGGISCSVAEMAKESGGAIVDIDKVPTKYLGLTPWEIWISESQERMTLAIPKSKWKEFNNLMESRGVEAVVIGEFTNSKHCVVRNDGKIIMDIEMEFLHNGLPKTKLESVENKKFHKEPKLPNTINRTKEFIDLIKGKNVAGYSNISTQYDHEVQAGSVVKPLEGKGSINTDAQVIRPVLASERGVVLSYGLYPSYSDIDTYHMALASLDTAIRNNVAVGGAMNHMAILDNFCWCSSYDQARLYELVRAVQACYDGAVGYSAPLISGKDSMFNDFKGYDENGNFTAISIPPTLLVSSISVIPDINKVVTPEFKYAGDTVYLIGETHDELGASEYYINKYGKSGAIGNNVPQVNIKNNLKTYKALESVISKELIASSISVNSGGLAVALARASVGGMLGINVDLKNLSGTSSHIDAKLFSESQGRIVVSVAKNNMIAFEKMMKGVSITKLGTVGGKNIVIKNGREKVVDTTVIKLSDVYHNLAKKL